MASASSEVLLTLSAMGYSENYISRAIKVHHKSKFGTDYNLSLIVEIIDRLKQKDANCNKKKFEEYQPHFSSVNELLTYLTNHYFIDYRFENGRYILCKIIERNLKYQHRILLHPASQPLSETKHNKYCFIYNEYRKLAPEKSITLRKIKGNKHPLYNIKLDDYLDINPMHKQGHSGWKKGQIIKIDDDSSQVKVLYFAMNENHSYWIHLENKEEAAPFNTKSDALKHSKMSNINQKAEEQKENVLSFNNNKQQAMDNLMGVHVVDTMGAIKHENVNETEAIKSNVKQQQHIVGANVMDTMGALNVKNQEGVDDIIHPDSETAYI